MAGISNQFNNCPGQKGKYSIVLLTLFLCLQFGIKAQQYPEGFTESYMECATSDEISCIPVYQELADFYLKELGQSSEEYAGAIEMIFILSVGEKNEAAALKSWQTWITLPVASEGSSEEVKEKIETFIVLTRFNGLDKLADDIEISQGLGETVTTRGKGLEEVTDLEALEKRYQDVAFLANYEKSQAIAQRAVEVATELYGPDSEEYYSWLPKLLTSALVMENLEKYVTEAENYFAYVDKRRELEPERYEQARNLLNLTLQAAGRTEEARDLITKDLPDVDEFSSISLLADFIKTQESELTTPDKSQVLQPYYRHLFEMQPSGVTEQNIYHQQIYYYLAQSTYSIDPSLGEEEKAKVNNWHSELMRTLLDYRKRNGGTSSPAYREALGLASAQALRTGNWEAGLNLLLEDFEYVWANENPAPEDISSSIFYFSSLPNNPASKRFMERYKDEVLEKYKNDNSSGAESLRSSLVLPPGGLEYLAQQASFKKRVPPLVFPNSLDGASYQKGDKNPKGVTEKMLQLYSTTNLLEFDYDLESYILNEGQIYEDALLNFIRQGNRRSSFVGQLLDLSIQRENFLANRIDRKPALDQLAKTNKQLKERLEEDRTELEILMKRYQAGKITFQEYGTQIYKNQQNDLEKTYLSGNWQPTEALSYKDIASSLSPGEAVVKIYRFFSRNKGEWYSEINYGAVVLAAGAAPVYVDIPGKDSIEFEFFNQYLLGISSVQRGESYERYWKAIREASPSVRAYYVVNQGIYDRLAPALLYDSKQDLYLLDECSFTFLTDLSSLIKPTIERSQLSNALLIGRPHYSTGGSPPASGQGRYAPLDEGGTPIWTDLPYTAIEVDSIQGIALKSYVTTQCLKGSDASKETVLKLFKGHSILHFATHGYFDPKLGAQQFMSFLPPEDKRSKDGQLRGSTGYPEGGQYLRDGKGRWGTEDSLQWEAYVDQVRANEENGTGNSFAFWWKDADELVEYQKKAQRQSGIIMAGANEDQTGERSILFKTDFSSMDFSKTQLVVLSACDFGKEDLLDGDKLGGFRNILQNKGVKYLISSIWRVEDRDGMQFMISFYRHWLIEKLPIEQAFSSAQREVKERELPLSHWGGFILNKL